MLDGVKALIEAGFSVIWLKERSKAPLEAKWTSQPTYTLKELKASYRDGNNVGVRLGKPSVVRKKYLHVIDLDVRDPTYAKQALKQAQMLLETDFEGWPTVISGSGGESRHFYFLCDEHFSTKKLWHADKKIVGEDGKDHWAAEIDLLGTGKQVVLPPSIHPDTGKRYRWEAEFDEADLVVVDADLLKAVTGEDDYVEDGNFEPLGLQFEEVENALSHIQHWADDHETWRNVGMAIKHEFGADGWPIFDRWSKRGRGYNKGENRLQYRAFRNDRKKPITMRTVMQAANEAMRAIDEEMILDELKELSQEQREPKPLGKSALIRMFEEECGKIEKQAPAKGRVRGVPPHLLKVPGKLGLAVDHYNATSIKSQPQFAVQTALALGSVVLGRYWKSDVDNFTALYLVNLGETGSGKEFCRTFLSNTLAAAKVERLVGPSQYTSEAAVVGELRYYPRHIAVIDEFGKILGSAKNSANTNAQDAQTALMSVFGAAATGFRPKSYSSNGKTSKQIAAEKTSVLVRPSLTLIGLSTQSTFFDALGQDDVASGFMNRLLVVDSRMPRQLKQLKPWSPPPKKLIEWIRDFVLPDELMNFLESEFDRDAEAGNPYGEEFDKPAEAQIVPFSTEARRRLVEIEQEINDLADGLTHMRLDGLYARSHEIAMRIALIVAMSMDRRELTIEVEDVDWAWDYVKFYTAETVENAKTQLGSNQYVKVAEHLAQVIEKQGKKGLSVREMTRVSHEFRQLTRRERDDVLNYLTTSHDVEEVEVKGSVGRPTKRYLPKEVADELMSRSANRRKREFDDLA